MPYTEMEQRRERAYRAALYYTDRDDIEACITDLLTDLLHLTEHDYGGHQDYLQRALRHYQTEQAEAHA